MGYQVGRFESSKVSNVRTFQRSNFPTSYSHCSRKCALNLISTYVLLLRDLLVPLVCTHRDSKMAHRSGAWLCAMPVQLVRLDVGHITRVEVERFFALLLHTGLPLYDV